MDKEQLISLIRQKVTDGVISKNEIFSIFDDKKDPVGSLDIDKEKEQIGAGNKFVNALYVIGVIIIIVGILILLFQNWREIGFLGRVSSTLGIATVAYIIAFATVRTGEEKLSQVMFLLSAVVAPIGVYVLLSEAGYRIGLNTYMISSVILTLFYGLTQVYAKNRILVLVTIFYGTSLYFSSIAKITELVGYSLPENLLKNAVIILGFAYYLIAYGYSKITNNDTENNKEKDVVSNFIYSIGSLFILVPFMTFGGVWDFLALIIIFAVAYLSFFVKSKFMFFISAGFLVAQLVSLTWEYFRDYTSWPIMLILIGAFTIGIAYVSIRLSKKIKKI